MKYFKITEVNGKKSEGINIVDVSDSRAKEALKDFAKMGFKTKEIQVDEFMSLQSILHRQNEGGLT